jgi:hypothetical protein
VNLTAFRIAPVAVVTAAGCWLAACSSEQDASAQGGPSPSGPVPVVEVVFDELPTATLMNPSGTRVDRRRFPGFAELAKHSTWYRNNTTVADFTGRAVPAIETGINPEYDTLPIASQQPNSIFTVLGGRYRFNVSEPVTRICPAQYCGKEPGRGAGDTFEGVTAGEFAQSAFAKPKPKLFARFLRRLSGGRSFNFIHFELPHEPFHFLPDGRSYNHSPISDVGNHNAQKWAGGVGGAATTWQRHLIQTGYADTLLRRTIRRLKQVGIWNRALVIVTADHGISFDPSNFRRLAFKGNFGGVANPPLFIKFPGQRKGEVSDSHTRTVDLVPTTAAVIGIEMPYRTDGEPITADGSLDGSGTDTVTLSSGFNREIAEQFDEVLRQRQEVLRRQGRWLGTRTGLFELGPTPSLLGRRVPRAGGGSAQLDPNLDLGSVTLAKGRKVPAFVNGTVAAGRAGAVLAIAVNGRVAATCRAFRFHGRTRWGAVVPPRSLRRGSNTVGVFLVRGKRLVPLGGA